MARRKNAPESIRLKHSLSERLRELRTEFFGERGGPDMARTLGILVRTWYNYESGVTVPAEIILQVVELTSVEPVWLLRGEGPKFRPATPATAAGEGLQNWPRPRCTTSWSSPGLTPARWSAGSSTAAGSPSSGPRTWP